MFILSNLDRRRVRLLPCICNNGPLLLTKLGLVYPVDERRGFVGEACLSILRHGEAAANLRVPLISF